jgi:sulfotransferase
MLNSVHFIAGLPRSGSTLLAALLRQNPAFHADITGPVAQLCGLMHQTIGGSGEFSVMFDEARCAQMLRGLFEIYYAHVPPGRVIFDTNRTWAARLPLLGALYGQCRVLCCVREIGWILDSIERMRAKNPLKLSKLFSPHSSESIYSRVDALMNSESGLVGLAWSALREAWFGADAGRLIVIPYDVLVREPEKALRVIYRELGEPYYEHDFRRVHYQAPEYDEHLGVEGLHTVRPVVEWRERQPTIPPDLFTRYARSQFWENPELNVRGVTIV